MSNLYLPEGWLNMEAVENIDANFIFVFGGRGIGKTYGMQRQIDKRHRGHVFFMRRTKTEWDIITDDKMNMFSSYNQDNGTAFRFDTDKGIARIVDGDADSGEFIGLSAPLSTFSNLRGFDNFQNLTIMYYDEFIPERHKARIRNEHEVFLNVYESVNRNRELKGQAPVKCICLANANDLKNPLFIGLNLVSMAEKMKRKDREILIDTRRKIALVDCSYSPISQRKANTALYQLAGEGDFFNMAIKNEFNTDLLPSVSRRIIEYRPVVSVGEINIYRHKSKPLYYVSAIRQTAPYYSAGDTQLEMFRIKYDGLIDAFYSHHIEFESNILQLLFMTYCKII